MEERPLSPRLIQVKQKKIVTTKKIEHARKLREDLTLARTSILEGMVFIILIFGDDDVHKTFLLQHKEAFDTLITHKVLEEFILYSRSQVNYSERFQSDADWLRNYFIK